MSNLKNIDKYYNIIIENLNILNNKIKNSVDILFEIINTIFFLNVVTFPNEIVMLYIQLRDQYDTLFSNDNDKNGILDLAVKENLLIAYRDCLLILFIYMLIVVYLCNHGNCEDIINTLIPLLLKAMEIFIDEANAFNLLMSYINTAKVFCLKNESCEKCIIINSLNIIGSEFY